jgi:hypothetical protein
MILTADSRFHESDAQKKAKTKVAVTTPAFAEAFALGGRQP